MHMAVMWSCRSVCSRLRVGAIITSGDMRQVLSIGYNGPARGLPHNSCTGNPGQCGCLHAEDNAIAQLSASHHRNLVLFSTAAPCVMCAQRIVNAGIRVVHYQTEYRNDAGLDMLRRCNVHTKHHDPFDITNAWLP